MEIVNLHLYPSAFKFESRILKETSSIIKLKLATSIVILSAGEKGQLADEKIDENRRVHRIISYLPSTDDSRVLKALFYMEFYLRAFVFGIRQKTKVINCHSLMMLPLAVVLKGIKGAKLIYDPHELETERLGLHGAGQRISKFLERSLISACDATIVVSDSILKWYTSTYSLKNIFLIRNVPYYFQSAKSNFLREKFEIPEGKLIFIYQGLINEGRSIEIYLSAFSKTDLHHLVIMGYGPMTQIVKEHAAKYPNIHFQPAVKPNEVLSYTQSADVGLSLIENCCLSYYYSLPNKFFEYMMSEIPQVVSNFPDMSGIINAHDIGWSINVTEEELIRVIITVSPEDILEKKIKLGIIKNRYTWEEEELVLPKIFESLRLNQ